MNKLEGFLALRESGLPSVPWKKYDKNVMFDSEILWTVRCAVSKGNDLNLPRKVGIAAKEAKAFADDLMDTMNVNDLILYYPYFIAMKSGVIEISNGRTVIEAVKDDLWNLVTNNKVDVSIIFDDDLQFIGDADFLSSDELYELIDYCTMIRKKFISTIQDGKSIILEWSFGCKTNMIREIIGDPTLLFYEIRTV
jgi:hypothetical protein